MPSANSTVTGSLLLTTLLTNCQILPVTQSLLRVEEGDVGPDLPKTSHERLVAGGPSWSQAADGGGDAGAGDVRGERQVGEDSGTAYYSRELRRGGSGRKGGGGKFSTYRYLDEPSSVNNTQTNDESDPGAVMYIIVVLVFYSTGVMVMIVRYLRTEKKELEEEVTLENFFKSMPDKQTEKENRVNRMAIRAFHTLTSVSYDDEDLEALDLGSDTESGSRGGDRNSTSDTTSSQPLLMTDL